MTPFQLQQLTLSPRTRQVIYLVIALAWVLTQALVPVLGPSSKVVVCLGIAIPLLSSVFLGVAAAHVYAPTGLTDPDPAPATPPSTAGDATMGSTLQAPSTPVNPDPAPSAPATSPVPVAYSGTTWTDPAANGAPVIAPAPAPQSVTS